jgi:integrase
MLSLCSIYGLRAGEVVNLKLDDFDWANETFTVHRGKRGRVQQFPLQYEVGEKILGYLKHARPNTACRHLFITLKPPYRPVSSATIWTIIAKRIERLGGPIENFGPHSLRHACATHLLRNGCALKDIADFLGHRTMTSVGIYARFDVRSLRHVAAFSLAGVK